MFFSKGSDNIIYVSQNELHKEILKPRIPKNYFTNNGYENNSIPRICFSNNVQNCLMALSDKLNGKVFYVYKPNNKINIITNNEIINKNMYQMLLLLKKYGV